MNFAENKEVSPVVPATEKSPDSGEAKFERGQQPEGVAAKEAPSDRAPIDPSQIIAAIPPKPAAAPKDPRLMQVERVLEDDLVETYLKMTPVQRVRFREAGEQAASSIWNLIEHSKATAKAVLKILTSWLRLIPGINRYFLEQAAKIKTDQVMRIADERRRQKENETL